MVVVDTQKISKTAKRRGISYSNRKENHNDRTSIRVESRKSTEGKEVTLNHAKNDSLIEPLTEINPKENAFNLRDNEPAKEHSLAKVIDDIKLMTTVEMSWPWMVLVKTLIFLALNLKEGTCTKPFFFFFFFLSKL